MRRTKDGMYKPTASKRIIHAPDADGVRETDVESVTVGVTDKDGLTEYKPGQ